VDDGSPDAVDGSGFAANAVAPAQRSAVDSSVAPSVLFRPIDRSSTARPARGGGTATLLIRP
jgi:hypothetical protein